MRDLLHRDNCGGWKATSHTGLMRKIRALQWVFQVVPPPTCRCAGLPVVADRRRAGRGAEGVQAPRGSLNEHATEDRGAPRYPPNVSRKPAPGRLGWGGDRERAPVYCFGEFRRRGGSHRAMMRAWAPPETSIHTPAEELIQTFIRMHTPTHCHSIYSLTLGKQINCVINKFS